MKIPQFKSWMIFLNLRMGVMFAAISLISVTFHIMIVLTNNHWVIHTGIIMYVSLILITWVIAFAGAHLQSINLTLIAIVLWACFIVSWLFVGILSHFSEKFGSTLCVDGRCALSLWLFRNVYYDAFYEKFDYFYHLPHSRPTNKPVRDPFTYFEISDLDEPEYLSLVSNKKENFQMRLTLAIITFFLSSVSTIMHLVSTWILLYSYYRELKCRTFM